MDLLTAEMAKAGPVHVAAGTCSINWQLTESISRFSSFLCITGENTA